MRYEGGDPCSSGKKRSTTVELKCGSVASLDSWSEPATCEYHATVTCPEACESGSQAGSESSMVVQSGAGGVAAGHQSQATAHNMAGGKLQLGNPTVVPLVVPSGGGGTAPG